MKLVVHGVLAMMITPILVFIWIMIANQFHWGLFTGWGMAHAGFIIAIPVSFAASFCGLLLPAFRSRIAASLAMTLVALIFVAWIGLLGLDYF